MVAKENGGVSIQTRWQTKNVKRIVLISIVTFAILFLYECTCYAERIVKLDNLSLDVKGHVQFIKAQDLSYSHEKDMGQVLLGDYEIH